MTSRQEVGSDTSGKITLIYDHTASSRQSAPRRRDGVLRIFCSSLSLWIQHRIYWVLIWFKAVIISSIALKQISMS